MKPNPADTALEKALRQQAHAATPEFSSDRHARLMAMVRSTPSLATDVMAQRVFRIIFQRVLPAAAVAAVIATAISLWTIPPAKQVAKPLHMPTIDVTPLVQDAENLEERRYAYLDRDAQHLAMFVVNQFPAPLIPPERRGP